VSTAARNPRRPLRPGVRLTAAAQRGQREPFAISRPGDSEARLSFKLGFLLLGVFPTDIFTSKARQWMNDKTWVVNEIVLGLFIALTISDIAG